MSQTTLISSEAEVLVWSRINMRQRLSEVLQQSLRFGCKIGLSMGDFITVVFTIPAIGLLIDGLIIGYQLKNRTGIKIAQFAVVSSKGFGYAFLINVYLQ